MRHTARSTRNPPIRSTGLPSAPSRGPAVHAIRQIVGLILLALSALTFTPRVHAQSEHSPADLGMTFTQQRSKFLGSASTDFFYLRGATVDYGTDLYHGFGPTFSVNGLAVTNLRHQIDIHQASFMGGLRYTYSRGHITPTIWNRRGSIFAEAQTGYVLATAGYYPVGGKIVSNASNITYSLGGGINYNIYHAFELRLMSHYVITDLPNGGTNQQKNIQGSLGVNWHFGH